MDFKKLDTKRLRRIYETVKTSGDFRLVAGNEKISRDKDYFLSLSPEEQDAYRAKSQEEYPELFDWVRGGRDPKVYSSAEQSIDQFIETELKPMVVEIIETKLGKDFLPVTFEEDSADYYAAYIHDVIGRKKINVMPETLRDVALGKISLFDLITTILHECRHAQQYALSEGVSLDSSSQVEQKFLLEAVDYIKRGSSEISKDEAVALYKYMGESRLSDESKAFIKSRIKAPSMTTEELRGEFLYEVDFIAYAEAVHERDARVASAEEMNQGFDDLFSILGVEAEEADQIRKKFYGDKVAKDWLDTEEGMAIIAELKSITASKQELIDLFQRLEDVKTTISILRDREDLQQSEEYSFLQTKFSDPENSEIILYESCLSALFKVADAEQLLTYLEFIEDEKFTTYTSDNDKVESQKSSNTQGKVILLNAIKKRYEENPEAVEALILQRVKTNPKLAVFLANLKNDKISSVGRDYLLSAQSSVDDIELSGFSVQEKRDLFMAKIKKNPESLSDKSVIAKLREIFSPSNSPENINEILTCIEKHIKGQRTNSNPEITELLSKGKRSIIRAVKKHAQENNVSEEEAIRSLGFSDVLKRIDEISEKALTDKKVESVDSVEWLLGGGEKSQSSSERPLSAGERLLKRRAEKQQEVQSPSVEVEETTQTHEEFLTAVVERVSAEEIAQARRDEEEDAKRAEEVRSRDESLSKISVVSGEAKTLLSDKKSKKDKSSPSVNIDQLETIDDDDHSM